MSTLRTFHLDFYARNPRLLARHMHGHGTIFGPGTSDITRLLTHTGCHPEGFPLHPESYGNDSPFPPMLPPADVDEETAA